MVKTLQNLLSNRMADDLETKYAASGTQVLQNLLKWRPLVDLDLFYVKVKFNHFGFCIEKGLTVNFPDSLVTCNIKIDICKQLKELLLIPKVKVIY